MRIPALFLSLMMPVLVLAAGPGITDFSGIDALPPDERFRQLSLMLLVSDGADERLISALSDQLGQTGADDQESDPTSIDFDDYTTPLIRIVDQRTMLQGATRLFQFTRDHAEGIAARIDQLQAQAMESGEPFSGHAISEDAIIIRNAIADSIDYALISDASPERTNPAANYRARTTYLRNNLEYELFAADLERITAEAVADVGGRTEAYERMFDDEVDASAIDKKIQAAEYAYGWDRDFDERAAKLAEKMLEVIATDESVPDL